MIWPRIMEKKQLTANRIALAYAGLFLAVFFWAINTVIAKAVIFQIKPMALSFYRWVVAFIIILPFAVPHFKKDGASIASVFMYLLPVFTSIIACLFLKESL